MERLFWPCTRVLDLVENQGDIGEDTRDELHFGEELNLNVSTQELLSAERAFTYADLYAMLGGNRDTLAWLSLHAFVAVGATGGVVRYWEQEDHEEDFCCFAFTIIKGAEVVAVARSRDHLLEICDVVLRLLVATSTVQSVFLNNWCPPGFFINALTFAHLLEQCQSLKILLLKNLEMDEDHCRVLVQARPQDRTGRL
jgi:hypothetical protein